MTVWAAIAPYQDVHVNAVQVSVAAGGRADGNHDRLSSSDHADVCEFTGSTDSDVADKR